jgi:hypothetical protein
LAQSLSSLQGRREKIVEKPSGKILRLSLELFPTHAIQLNSLRLCFVFHQGIRCANLLALLPEMTQHISPVDDHDLIEHLRGSLDPIQTLHPSPSGGIADIVNSLAKRERYHRYAKTFTTILKYSLLAVQRY